MLGRGGSLASLLLCGTVANLLADAGLVSTVGGILVLEVAVYWGPIFSVAQRGAVLRALPPLVYLVVLLCRTQSERHVQGWQPVPRRSEGGRGCRRAVQTWKLRGPVCHVANTPASRPVPTGTSSSDQGTKQDQALCQMGRRLITSSRMSACRHGAEQCRTWELGAFWQMAASMPLLAMLMTPNRTGGRLADLPLRGRTGSSSDQQLYFFLVAHRANVVIAGGVP